MYNVRELRGIKFDVRHFAFTFSQYYYYYYGGDLKRVRKFRINTHKFVID